jgi:hypothetical protein
VAFDFESLSVGDTLATLTDPTTLFEALPDKKAGYGYLRAVQQAVLEQWSKRRDQHDVVVKTNTGGGKTVVGLLILQCCLNEGDGPALYLTPTSDLARRVRAEANNLGLTTVDDPRQPKFLRSEAICVTTMNVLVNGKTRFGLTVPESRYLPVPVGSVIIDDAHAALAMTEEKTRLVIPSDHEAYDKLLKLFDEDLRTQNLKTFLDVEAGDPTAVAAVPFWAWQDKHETAMQILHPHRGSSAFEWSWPLISDVLRLCQAVVTATGFEIMPPCPPIEKIPSFAEAGRRIYLTATLADDSVLVTHFDADPASIADSIVPPSAADLGDRLILAPQDLNPDITHDGVRALAKSIAAQHNVVVLAPSKRQAALWKDEANVTVSKPDAIDAAVARLTDGHVGLVVIINRYDGIDLPDDACRLLIIDSLPLAYSGIERREAVALRDSEAMVTRQLQRLEQGMGRGVRSRDDRCVVLLLGPQLIHLLAHPDYADRLSAATRAQIEVSRTVARKLEGCTAAELRPVIAQVIGNDPGFRKLSRSKLIGVTYGPASVSPYATHLRAAYNNAVAGRPREAADQAKAAVDAARADGDARLAGWLGETYAAYLHAVDPVRAQQALTNAGRDNTAVLKPRAGVEYHQIETPSTQAQQASTFLAGRYASAHEMSLGLAAVLADIDWDPGRTPEAEAALADLGRHLGFTAQMPERDFTIGSDVLWAIGDHTYWVIEAKTGATSPKIWKHDINQLGGSTNWCQNTYGNDAAVVPVLVHPSHVIERSGTPPHGTRVITTQKLKGLKAAVYQFMRAIADGDNYRNPAEIERQLVALKLDANSFIEAFTQTGYREPLDP